MNKYIDADKIRAEIKRQSKSIENATGDFAEGRRLEQRIILSVLDTLEAETSYDTQKYTPSPFVDIGDVARVQFASHAKVFDKKRKAVFDWEQFKEIASIFYGFGKKDPSDTLESEKPNALEEPVSEDLEEEMENYYGSIPDDEDKINAARHFAEWQKKQDEKNYTWVKQLPNPNIEKLDGIEITTSDSSAGGKELLYVSNKSYNIGFRDGMAEQKRKMMEGAVDVHIVKSYNPCTEEGKPTLHGVELLYEDEGKPYLVAGENARIVILPKEDEK